MAAARFSTALLDAAVSREREEREKLRLQMVECLLKALERLRHQMPFDEAYIFGSVTRPNRFSKGSDADVAFTGLKDEHFFRAMAFLSREVGLDVDVVQLEGHRLAEKIRREGIRWTGKG